MLAAVQWAAGEAEPLEIVGHGSKRGIGRPVQTEHVVDMSRLNGVTLYEPEELVLSARAGTPVAEIEARRATISSASTPCRDAAKPSSQAGGW